MEQAYPPSQHNIQTLELEPCETCGDFDGRLDPDEKCKDHYVPYGVINYTHFLIGGTWYTTPYKYKFIIGALLTIDAGMSISGRLDYPEPKKLRNLTELLSLCIKQGITDDELTKYFPEEQVKRMKGRVLKRLVRGR